MTQNTEPELLHTKSATQSQAFLDIIPSSAGVSNAFTTTNHYKTKEGLVNEVLPKKQKKIKNMKQTHKHQTNNNNNQIAKVQQKLNRITEKNRRQQTQKKIYKMTNNSKLLTNYQTPNITKLNLQIKQLKIQKKTRTHFQNQITLPQGKNKTV